MKLQRSWLLTVFITLAVAIWMASGMFVSEQHQQTANTVQPKTSSVKVRVKESTSVALTDRLILHGHTVAERNVTVKSETGAVVEKVLVHRGASVNKGQSLIRLAQDDRKSRLREANSLLEQRKAEYSAVQKLKKSGYQAETELAKTKAALDSARAVLQMAELELQRIDITSPFAGIVNERFVEVGDFLKRGEPVLTLVDLDPIRVTGQVSERYLNQLQSGETGEVRLMNGRVMPAKVTYIGSVANENTRTITVEMQVPNPLGKIIEGITVELRLPVKQVYGHKVSPSVLSLLDNGDLSVKAVGNENTIINYPVQLLGDSGDVIWLGGLPEKLTLVVVGHEFVLPGQAVIPVAIESRESNN